jgi:phosphate transport system substrate-binding protein
VAETEIEGKDPITDVAEERFSQEARAAGIVLPKRRRFDPWTAVAIVVAVVLVTAGIGEVTGWISLRSTPAAWSYQTQKCSGSDTHASGASSADLGPAFASWLAWVGAQMQSTVGSCFNLTLSSAAGDGYVPSLGGPKSEFAASFAPPTSSEVAALAASVVTVPVALGAVAILYNLPGVAGGLNLTGSALAGVFNGTITSWDDPGITGPNPGVALSGAPPITIFHDSTSSAATQVLTEYLSAESSSWNSTVGVGTSVDWPAGSAVESDAAMVSAVASTPGSIGYLELFGVPPSGVAVAHVEDLAGTFALPNSLGTWLAASADVNASALTTGNWTGFSLVGASSPGSYPLTALTFVGMYRDLGEAFGGALSLTNATWLLGYVYWLTAEPTVALLPAPFETAAVNVLNNETYNGATIMHLENEQNETQESGETDEF